MKCKKCGNEITSSDKYCNNCGTKVENSITPKPIYKYPKLWISIIGLAIIIVFFIIMLVAGYNSKKSMDEAVMEAYKHKSAEVVTEQPTTTDSHKYAEEDTDFTLEDMTFTIPKNWKYEYHKDFDWIGLEGPNGCNVQISVENQKLQDSIDDIYKIIDETRNAGITVVNSDESESNIAGEKATSILYAIKLGSSIMYNYAYVVQKDDYTYTLQSLYYEEEAINDHSVFISDIINSVKFKSNKKKSTTKKSAEPPTEKTTKKPTETPTEKPTSATDAMTKLYEDSEIAVYYKSIEKSLGRYTNVNLMFENKMNKSIEIQADTVVLDGITYNNVICSDPISANSKGMIEISVIDCDNTSPSTFGADLRYFDKDTYDNVIRLNIVSHSLK